MGTKEFATVANEQGLGPEEKFLLLTLAEHSGSYLSQPWATIDKEALHIRTCIPEGKLDEVLRRLADKGHLETTGHPEFSGEEIAILSKCPWPEEHPRDF